MRAGLKSHTARVGRAGLFLTCWVKKKKNNNPRAAAGVGPHPSETDCFTLYLQLYASLAAFSLFALFAGRHQHRLPEHSANPEGFRPHLLLNKRSLGDSKVCSVTDSLGHLPAPLTQG